jgi:two-component system sensor histidine kinase DesK
LQALAVVLFAICTLGLSVSVVQDVLAGRAPVGNGGFSGAGGFGGPASHGVVIGLVAAGVGALAGVAVTGLVLRRTLWRRRSPSRTAGLLALAVVAYAPALLLGVGWLSWSAVLACFALELLPPRPAGAVYLLGLLVRLGTGAAVGEAWGETLFAGISYVATSLLLFLVLRSVNTYRELELARAELAHAEVLAERVRVSRDLHDLLGRNLAAMSLKVELARRQGRAGRHEAVQSELEEVLALSHASAADLRALVAGYRAMTLRSELSAAVRLLTDAGVRCEVETDPGFDATAADEVVAWVLREAATNVVKHAEATRCSIVVRLTRLPREQSTLELVVENDGAGGGSAGGGGSGLVGARERVRARGGTVTTTSKDGSFRLRCSVPLPAEVLGRDRLELEEQAP